MKIILAITALFLSILAFGQQNSFRNIDADLMPYGMRHRSWEKTQEHPRTLYVDQKHPQASDDNPGSYETPLLTINRAAQLAKPGDRVLIRPGTYRESIHPARGGESPENMIVYEAETLGQVIVKGSVILNPAGWEASAGWHLGKVHPYDESPKDTMAYQYDLSSLDWHGYNPFGMVNMMHDQAHLDYTKVKMVSHFRRRGLVFINGLLIRQVSLSSDLMDNHDGAYWVEHNGLRLHVRFPDNIKPANAIVEVTTKEQLFAPKKYGLGYIKLVGIHFMHAGNGFPVPQRGMVSASRGHHWIIENCTIEWANGLGIDLGNEMWSTTREPVTGHHIIRANTIRNCGVSGLQGQRGENYLIEDNLFENIGWHDVEHGWESGAIKLHLSKNTLIRRNVFRNIVHAPGIWLDYLASENCRITQNVFTGITTARGAIYIEVSHEQMRIDHNVFHNTKSQWWISGDYGAGGSALYTDGSDSIRFEYNLATDIENTGFGAYANANRIVAGRGGTDRNHRVTHNIFSACGKHAIEFPNQHHFSDHNVFSNMPAAFLTIKHPEPSLKLNLKAWQDHFKWDINGKVIRDVSFEIDPETLVMKGKNGSLIPANTGPFNDNADYSKGFSIDPRQIPKK